MVTLPDEEEEEKPAKFVDPLPTDQPNPIYKGVDKHIKEDDQTPASPSYNDDYY